MFLDVEHHVQITGRSAVEAALAESREGDAGTVFDACWNFRVHRPLTQKAALAFALGTGIGDHAAGALASRAGAGNAEKTLLVAYLSTTGTGTAGNGSLPRCGS